MNLSQWSTRLRACLPSGLATWLVAEVLVLAAVQAPNERLIRYVGFDSGVDLTIQHLLRRGLRPTVDFGCIYGLLPLAINRAWYGVWGLSPRAFRAGAVLGTCLTAWGMARFARARRVGPAGVALIVLAMPDVLLSSYQTSVHVLEPAALVHALAEQARGRRANALALATLACFLKPSMGYVLGLALLIAIALASRGEGGGRAYWVRSLGPATVAGLTLALAMAGTFGVGPLLRTIVPVSGMANYRMEHYGFFRGVGRDFWVLPGAGLRDYLRYEVGFWLAGTVWLAACGVVGLVRLARGRAPGERAIDDELVACCAGLHLAFVTAFFGNRMSWVYYFAILVLGLAAASKGGRTRVAVAWVLAVMLVVNDRSKLLVTYRDWSTSSRSAETLGLWTNPGERAEWREVRRLAEGRRAVLLARFDGAVILPPPFEPPVAAYFFPGETLPAEARRKAEQLASAEVVVSLVGPDWRGFAFWPELARALDGCEVALAGKTFRVYRRVRPPAREDG